MESASCQVNPVLLVLLVSTTLLLCLSLNRIPLELSTIQQTSTTTTTSSEVTSHRHPRIALCLTGNARTFHYPLVHEHILKNVLHPLQQSEYPVDVFFNIKLTDDPRPNFPRSPSFDHENLRAIAKFNPLIVRLLNHSHDFVSNRSDSTKRKIKSPTYCHNTSFEDAMLPYSLHRARQCVSLIRQAETQRGEHYAWIYRMRPDVVFLEPIDTPDQLVSGTLVTNIGSPKHIVSSFSSSSSSSSSNLSISNINFNNSFFSPHFTDHFMAGTRDDMMQALQAVHAVDECAFFNVPRRRNAETAVGFWSMSHGLAIVARDWLWVLVRADVGPECHRIRLWTVEKVRKNIMSRNCQRFLRLFHKLYSNSTVKAKAKV